MLLPSLRTAALGATAAVAAGVVTVIVLGLSRATGAETAAPADEQRPAARPSREAPVHLTKAERAALRIATGTAHYQVRPEELRMSATTALDPDALAHVHPRFGGEATEVKARLGQHVKRGQVLAVVWSKDLGEKKSEYIDNRSQYRLNQTVADRMKDAYAKGAIPGEEYLRTISMPGLSSVTVQFRYGDHWRARQQVINRIAQAQLPQGVTRRD